MDEFKVEPIWFGQTLVVIGGGQSLTLSQLRRVAKARLEERCGVLAVNDAIFVAWWADWLHSQDAKWWHANIRFVQHFTGLKTTLDDTLPLAWKVRRLKNTGRHGFDPDSANCRSGANSGYQAVHCALHAGAAKIILLGMDMHGKHWHEGHPGVPVADFAGVMLPHFAELLPAIADRQVDVVNCSPGSAIDCFRRGDLEQELPVTP